MPDAAGHLVFPGQPMPMGRPRFARRGRAGVSTRTPDECKRRMAELALAWVEAGLPYLGDQLVRLRCSFIFARPSSHLGSAGRVLPSKAGLHPGQDAGDIDNLIKLVMDGLQRPHPFSGKPTCLANDARVVEVFAEKLYADHVGVSTAQTIVSVAVID